MLENIAMEGLESDVGPDEGANTAEKEVKAGSGALEKAGTGVHVYAVENPDRPETFFSPGREESAPAVFELAPCAGMEHTV